MRLLKEGCLLAGIHKPGGRVFPRLPLSPRSVLIRNLKDGIIIGFELRILLRAHSDTTSHGTPTQYPELGLPK